MNLKKNKKGFFLIGVGALNFIHGILHIFQFIQSVILVQSSLTDEHSGFFDNPIFSLLWAIIGLVTLIIGIKDFLHHKDCH